MSEAVEVEVKEADEISPVKNLATDDISLVKSLEAIDPETLDPEIRSVYDELHGLIQATFRRLIGENDGKKVADAALFVPDVVILIMRLMTDDRVPGKLKLQLALATIYAFNPIDLIPSFLFGAVGLADNALAMTLSMSILRNINQMEGDLLEQHWSGSEESLNVMRGTIGAAYTLVDGTIGALYRKILG